MTRRLTMQQRIKQGLVAYWPLADLSAVDLKSRLYDARGPYDLTNNNTVTRAAGPSANLPSAADFDAASNQFFATTSTVFPATRTFAVAAWAKLDTTGATLRGICSKRGATNHFLLRKSASDQYEMVVWNAANSAITATDTGLTLAGGEWNLVVGGWEANRCFVEVVGRPRVYAACVGLKSGGGSVIMGIGGSSPITGDWDGQIQGLAVWDGRIPTDAELFHLKNNGQGRDLVRGV